MAEMNIGGSPGTVYSETDQVQGKCPGLGALYTDHQGNKYVLVKVSTGNLTNGTCVTLAASHIATANAGGADTVANRIGVLVVSATASTSSICWAQVYGAGFVIASTSALPGVALGFGTTAGQVDDTVTSASAAITGMVLTATSQSAAGLTACFLDFPSLYSSGL